MRESSFFFFFPLPSREQRLVVTKYIYGLLCSSRWPGPAFPAGFFHALLAEEPAKPFSDLSGYGCCPGCRGAAGHLHAYLPGAGETPEGMMLTPRYKMCSPPSLSPPLSFSLLPPLLPIPFTLPLPLFVLRQLHVAQAGFRLTVRPRMNLNSGTSCLHFSNAGISGVHHQT